MSKKKKNIFALCFFVVCFFSIIVGGVCCGILIANLPSHDVYKEDLVFLDLHEKNNAVLCSQKSEVVMQKQFSADDKELIQKPRLIFVFDDAGHNISQLEPFLKLPFDLTVAVLPGLAHSEDAAVLAMKYNKEIILHQPMQAVNLEISPGPNAILPNMNLQEVKDIVEMNIQSLENVLNGEKLAGINNHEGSLITQNSDFMNVIIEVCKDRNMYFLDSRTIGTSVAEKCASDMNVPCFKRSIFLDNSKDRNDIIKQIQDGLEIADRNGSVVMIGHVWTEILSDILLELYPELIEKGYDFTTVGKCLK